MATAVKTLSIVGGIFGLLGATICGLAFIATLGRGTTGGEVGLAAVAFMLAIVGIAVGSTARRHPARALCWLVVAALGIAVCISWFAVLTSPLFLAAALLAFCMHAAPSRAVLPEAARPAQARSTASETRT
jgi:hypothetical protein